MSHMKEEPSHGRASAGSDVGRNSSQCPPSASQQQQIEELSEVPEAPLWSGPSSIMALASDPKFWAMDRVQQFLVIHGFSAHWSMVFWDLEIYGSKFLDLDSGHGGA